MINNQRDNKINLLVDLISEIRSWIRRLTRCRIAFLLLFCQLVDCGVLQGLLKLIELVLVHLTWSSCRRRTFSRCGMPSTWATLIPVSRKLSRARWVAFLTDERLCLCLFSPLQSTSEEPEIFKIRSYIAQREYQVVLDAVSKSAPQNLLALRHLAAYLDSHDSNTR